MFWLRYLDGDILFQAWGGVPSSEARLLVTKDRLDQPESDVWYNKPYAMGKIDYFNCAMRTEDFRDVPLRVQGHSPGDRDVKDGQGALSESSTKPGPVVLGDVWRETGLEVVGAERVNAPGAAFTQEWLFSPDADPAFPSR